MEVHVNPYFATVVFYSSNLPVIFQHPAIIRKPKSYRAGTPERPLLRLFYNDWFYLVSVLTMHKIFIKRQ